MKKASIFTFAALMLIMGTLSAFPASGAGISSLVDALVVHYDFNGETVEEALKDKAPKDSVDDDLLCFVSKSSDGESFAVNGTYSATALDPSSEAFSSAITWDAENGTVKAGNSVSLQAKNSAETRSLISSESTVVMRFYTGQVPQGQNAFLFSMASSVYDCSIIFELGYQEGATNKVFLRARIPNANGDISFVKLCYPLTDKWYTVAITIKEDAENGTITFGGKMNLNTETKWTEIPAGTVSDTLTNYKRNTAMYEVAPLSIFALPEGRGNNYATIDDFRLYNRILNSDEIELVGEAATTPPVIPDDSTSDTDAPSNNGGSVNTPEDTTDNSGNNNTSADTGSNKPNNDKNNGASTDAPVNGTENVTDSSTATDTAMAETGCGSSLGISAAAVALSSLLAVYATRKRRSK